MKGKGRGVDSFVLCSYTIWVKCLNDFVADCVAYSYAIIVLINPYPWLLKVPVVSKIV